MDELGHVIAASCTDKSVTLFETITGGVFGQVTSGEICTSLLFSSNYNQLITCTAEGNIFIWKVPQELSSALLKRKQEFFKVKEMRSFSAIQEAEEDLEGTVDRQESAEKVKKQAQNNIDL